MTQDTKVAIGVLVEAIHNATSTGYPEHDVPAKAQALAALGEVLRPTRTQYLAKKVRNYRRAVKQANAHAERHETAYALAWQRAKIAELKLDAAQKEIVHGFAREQLRARPIRHFIMRLMFQKRQQPQIEA